MNPAPSELYRVNVSSIQDFMQCPFRWVLKWVENRVPRNESAALAEGKLLHVIFEDHLRDKVPMKVAIEKHTEAWLEQAREQQSEIAMTVAQKAVNGIRERAEALEQWKDKYKFKVKALEVEKAFEIVLPQYDASIAWLGRPDRIGVMKEDGRLWHVQNRGLSASMNFGVYMELAKRHYHEHLYAEYMSIAYGKKYKVGGTLFNLVRKLKYRTNVGKKNEEVKSLEQMFFQHPMVIDLKSPLHEHVMMSMVAHVRRMREVEAEYRTFGSVPPPNEKANGGFLGNTIDPYFRVLCGTASLSDNNLFMDREDTYSVSETGNDE